MARTVRRALARATAALAALLLATGCTRLSDVTGPTPIGAVVASVDLSSDELSLGVGSTATLQATPRDAGGRAITDRVVFWSSSDSTRARVSPAGVVTALALGEVQIAASAGGQSAVARLTVRPRAVAGIDLTPAAPRVLVGGFTQLTAVLRDETGAPLTDRAVFWTSSDETIASVDATGFVSGLAPGVATITASSETRDAAVGIVVSPVPVASVIVSPPRDTIVVGQSTQLAAVARDSITVPLPDRPVTWQSSNAAVATVSASGLVIAVAPGTVTITATSDGVAGTGTIVVQPRPVGTVIVSPGQAAVTVGQTIALTVQITDDNGNLLTGRPVAYESGNAAVASVSTDGVVRGVAAGATTITVTSEGRTGSMQVTVLPTPVASIRVEPATASLAVGDSVRLTASALDAGGNVLAQRPVTWTSGAPTVLSVSATGSVRALAPGSGLVFAMIDGRLASATITVRAEPVTAVQVTPSSALVVIGNTLDLTAVARDQNAQVVPGRLVQWSSANALVAVVSSAGRVRATGIGTARIDATVDGVVGSSTITVSPIPVASVATVLAASALTVGQTTQATATLRDALGNVLTGRTVTWTSSTPTVATVSSTGLVTAVGGGSTNIVATSEGVSGTAALSVTQVAGSLQIQTQPAGAVSGAAFTTQPVIRILDASGLVVTTGAAATAAVTVTRASGTATLGGTTTVNAVAGVATFTNLAFTGLGTGAHTLTFATTTPALSVTSAPVTVTPGAAATITATSSLSQSVAAGTAVAAPPTVRVTDAGGNPVSGVAVTFTVTTGGGSIAPASPATVTTNASGVAALTSWTLGAVAGANAVTATATGLTGSPVTFAATGTIGAATQLGLLTQPAGAVSGVVLTTQPVIEIRDAAGNRVLGATSAITATIASGTGTLVGTATVNAVNGVATFTNLRIDGGGAHTLQFSAAGLAAATSASLTVNQVATTLQIQTQPVAARIGLTFTTQPVIRILDQAGLVITTGAHASLPVTATRASGLAVLSGTTTVTAVNGVATFTNLLFIGTGIGTHTLRFATASPPLEVVSADVLVSAGDAAAIQALSAQSQSATAGAAVSAPPSVRVIDADGNAVSGTNVTFTVTGGSGTTNPASPAVIATNASGVATLTSWTLGAVAGANTVTAASAGLSGSPVTFSATGIVGAATQLVITTQPAGAVSGTALTTQPVLQIRDAGGNLVTGATTAVTAAIASGSGTLVGTATVTAVNGVVTFTNLRIDGAGAHTLTFTAAGLTPATSNSITVSQTAASLQVQTQPAGAASGAAFTTQPVVRVLDNAGLVIASGANATLAVTASIGSGGGTLGGTVTVNAVAGVATFTNLAITGTGAHTLSFATVTPALTGTSASFTVGAGAPAQLGVFTQPAGAVSGVAFTTQPVIEIRDAGGNRVTSATTAVTAAIASGSGALVGTATVNAVAGLATFTNLRLDGTGAHTLTFTAGGLTAATSNSITVSQTAASLQVQTQPAGAASGAAFTTQPVVRVLDNAGLAVTTGAGATAAVTAAIATGSGTLGGTVTVNAVNGVATFTNLAITGTGAHTLSFSTVTPALTVTSASVTVGAGAPTQLGVFTQPAGAVSGVAFTTQPVIEIRDAGGNRVTSATTAVTAAIASGSGTLVGTVTVNAVAGVATFTNLRLDGAGAHTLTFTASGLTAATSGSIAVSQVAASLQIQTQPAGAVSGSAFTTQPVVRVLDNAGLVVTTGTGATLAVTAARASGSATLAGTLTVNAVNGVATFTDLAFTGTGTGAHTLSFATVTPALTVTSASVTVNAGAPTQLGILTQPAGAVSGAAFTTQPVIEIRDANGNRVTASTLSVTAAIASGTGALGGTVTVAAVAGVATFADLAITGAGPHTLTFTTVTPALGVTSANVEVEADDEPPPGFDFAASPMVMSPTAAAPAAGER